MEKTTSKNYLSFGASVEPGQWYDIRSEGLQHQSLYDTQIHEVQSSPITNFDCNLIDSLNLGEGLCETLKISPESFVQNISNSKNITFMYFVLPSVPKFLLIKVEKIFKQKRARFVNTVPDTTHFVKNVYYGNMVLIRLIPKNDETANLNSITENFDEFLKNGTNSSEFKVESLTNFNEWKHHESIQKAMEYANQRVEWRDENSKVVRFDLQKISKKQLWQEDEDSEGILERLLRLDFLCHSMEAFLKVAGNDAIDPTKIPTRKYFTDLTELGKIIDEKGKTLMKHDLINPKMNLPVSVIHGLAKDLFQSLLILKSDCQRFLRKRTQLLQRPKFENDVIDRNVVIFNLFHSVFGFLNRNNFETHFGELFHVIREPKHKNSIFLKQRKNQKYLIINGEKSVQDIQYYYDTFEAEKIFLTCLAEDASDGLKTSLMTEKNEKALYFEGNSVSYGLGHFKPNNPSQHENIEIQSLPWLILPCPCKQSIKGRHWLCTGCKQIVKIDESSPAMFCKCGISFPKDDQFKCLNENHSTNFTPFDENSNFRLPQPKTSNENANDEIENIFYDPQTEITYQKHPKLRNANGAAKRKLENAKQKSVRSKKINIAVIGESGVGKSTLLNAIANYLKFDTAKDAYEKDNLEYIIPCQFKVFYPDFSEKLISIGMPEENEKYEETVLSTTQECKEYSFEFNGYKINFIDTPGLSDTSGIEKDAKNLEKIRTFICSSLDSLHAICFVVKANEARMDLGFSNSMNDLLSIFPKSALSKVIFFMTHSRGTLYGPGDSMTPLKIVSEKLLKNKGITFPLTSENVFCVDNESFLFLCAKNQGIEYSGASFEDFENSWKKSKLATQRFFNKITTLKPLVTVEVQLINDLENVLQEQKEILNHKHSSCLLIFHYLTAKALELLELGNAANAYLKYIDLGTVKEEAEHCNVKIDHITPSASFLSFINFCLECESGETPVADSFIDKYFSE
jgi:GTPase SAR1 family protein